MKIQVIESYSKRPLANTKIQLQVKGKDSGFLSLTTDGSGYLTLDDKYNGQQISTTDSLQGITAGEGARLLVTTGSKQKKTETTYQGGSTK